MFRLSLRVLPGITLLAAGAGLAHVFSMAVSAVNELLLAVALGVVVGNTVGVPAWASAGVDTQKLWLETGIVLMGARIAIGQLFAVGVELLALVVGFLAFSLLFVELIARTVVEIPDRLGSLLAAGYSVCGVSAIVAVSSGIRARSEQIAYAVGTILLFDAMTLVVYPLVGRLLDLPDIVFGTWAGISMVSTGPVVAAGFAYSPTAGQWATVTKLGRNVFIGVLAVLYAVYYARKDGTDAGATDWRYLWSQFPKFVFGFVIVAVLASVGLLTESDVAMLERASQWLFLLAFVGLGTNIELAKIRETGFEPLLVVLVALLTVSALSLAGSLLVFA
ncbi:MAG: YeiH family protein [Halorhabdus sp.]